MKEKTMSTLPKIRLKSGNSKIDIVGGTLPRKKITYLSVSDKKVARDITNTARRILKYEGLFFIFFFNYFEEIF